MARKSTDDYIREALEAATFAADTVLPRRTLNLDGPGVVPRRYPPRSSIDRSGTLDNANFQSARGARDIADAVDALIRASGGKVSIKSGKRSTQRQAQLWAAAVRKYGSPAAARKWVAPPGRSRHETGEAYDLGGDLALAAKLAPQFGLYRPMSWEPWHFERVGSRRK